MATFRPRVERDGFSLVEVLVAISLVGIAAALVLPRSSFDRLALSRAARVAESQLVLARLKAQSAHVPTEVTLSGTELSVAWRGGAAISRVELGRHGVGRLDSARLRPATLRFNSRGHGSAGSLYLYSGGRGVRLVSSFVGRIRAEALER